MRVRHEPQLGVGITQPLVIPVGGLGQGGGGGRGGGQGDIRLVVCVLLQVLLQVFETSDDTK